MLQMSWSWEKGSLRGSLLSFTSWKSQQERQLKLDNPKQLGDYIFYKSPQDYDRLCGTCG